MEETPAPRLDEGVSLAVWLIGLAAIAGLVVVAFRDWPWTTNDLEQQRGLVTGIAHLDLQGAYQNTQQTSGPGYGLYAQPAFLISRVVVGASDAYRLAGATTLVALAVAAIAAVRGVGVRARSLRELFLVALVMVGVPTLACFSEQWHPSDLLATALCLGAFATRCRGHRLTTAILFGAALATRQWALIPLAVTVTLEERGNRVSMVLAAGGFAGLITLPFLIAEPDHVISALRGGDTLYGDTGVVGLLPLGPTGRLLVSRYVPLLFTAAACTWLYRRKLRWDGELAAAAFASTMLFRAAIDPALYAYYLAPGAAFFTIMWRRSWMPPVLAFTAGVLLKWRLSVSLIYPGLLSPGSGISLVPGRTLAAGTTLVLAAGIVAAWLQMRRRGLALAGRQPAADRGPGLAVRSST